MSMMTSTNSTILQANDWADIVELLHNLSNTMTVRSHYVEGHPAIKRADDLAGTAFVRVLGRVPEIIVALIDGEFYICERPLPDLRERLQALAAAMIRHEVECIVFQRGMTNGECAILGRFLGSAADSTGASKRAVAAELGHVLLRYVELKKTEAGRATATSAFHFVPRVAEILESTARAIASDGALERDRILELAKEIVASCSLRTFTLTQRAWTRSIDDEAIHATNVAMTTGAMALDIGMAERLVVELVGAAILHDIGHLLLPDDIRGMPEPSLDERGRMLFRNHTFAGASALLGAGAPPLWVAAALEHHRGIDGGGYPVLESNAAPDEVVRMIGLANYFDRKRTLLEGHSDSPDDVLRKAANLEDRYFGAPLVDRFVRALGVFPPGTTVELSDRQPAFVLSANPTDPWRPRVMLLRGVDSGKEVDLRETSATQGRHYVSIVRAIPPPLFVLGDVVRDSLGGSAPKPPVDVGVASLLAVDDDALAKLMASTAEAMMSAQAAAAPGTLDDDALATLMAARAKAITAESGAQSTTTTTTSSSPAKPLAGMRTTTPPPQLIAAAVAAARAKAKAMEEVAVKKAAEEAVVVAPAKPVVTISASSQKDNSDADELEALLSKATLQPKPAKDADELQKPKPAKDADELQKPKPVKDADELQKPKPVKDVDELQNLLATFLSSQNQPEPSPFAPPSSKPQTRAAPSSSTTPPKESKPPVSVSSYSSTTPAKKTPTPEATGASSTTPPKELSKAPVVSSSYSSTTPAKKTPTSEATGASSTTPPKELSRAPVVSSSYSSTTPPTKKTPTPEADLPPPSSRRGQVAVSSPPISGPRIPIAVSVPPVQFSEKPPPARESKINIVESSRPPSSSPLGVSSPNPRDSSSSLRSSSSSSSASLREMGGGMSNVPSPRLTAPPIVTKVMVDGTADEMLAKLGSMTAVPRALGTPPPGLDHRCGFLLTFIDGVSTIEDIIDACGLPKDEVVRILGELLMVGVVKT